MLMKEKIGINLPHEEFNDLEMIIMVKKKAFLNDISKKSLKKKMIKEMLNNGNSIMMFYLMPINIIFLLLSLLSKKQGYDQDISATLFIIGWFFCFSYILPFVRGCMLPFLRQKIKNKMKHDIFMDSIADNDVLKLFIKKYGKNVLTNMMAGEAKVTYKDIYNYHINHNKKEEAYRNASEVVKCIESMK